MFKNMTSIYTMLFNPFVIKFKINFYKWLNNSLCLENI